MSNSVTTVSKTAFAPSRGMTWAILDHIGSSATALIDSLILEKR
jgi:hypothetical protein